MPHKHIASLAVLVLKTAPQNRKSREVALHFCKAAAVQESWWAGRQNGCGASVFYWSPTKPERLLLEQGQDIQANDLCWEQAPGGKAFPRSFYNYYLIFWFWFFLQLISVTWLSLISCLTSPSSAFFLHHPLQELPCITLLLGTAKCSLLYTAN